MKKVGIDGRLLTQTGVGVYIRNLCHYLQALPTNEIEFHLYMMKSDHNAPILTELTKFTLHEVTSRWHSFAEQTSFYRVLLGDSLDLMHFTYFSYPVLYRRPFIATIHDTTPLFFKTGKASTRSPFVYSFKHLAFKRILSQQIYSSQAIITPTQTVATDLIKLYGTKIEKKLHILHEGVNFELQKIKPNNELKTKFKHPFFIYVGNFYPHKNIEHLLSEFSHYQGEEKLVLIGPQDYFSKRISRQVHELKLQSRVLFFHNASNEDLVFFYKNAKALIYPSLSEGFGLPLVEAMNFQLPVIASDIPVIREILGKEYFKFPPERKNSIVESLIKFSTENAKPDYGLFEKKLSFQKMSEQTLSIYNDLLLS